MTQYPNSPEPWQMAAVPGNENAKKASVCLWILAGLQCLFFGSCSAILGLISVIPMQELLNNPGMQEIDEQMLSQVYEMAPIMAVMLFVIACVPALVYAVAAFYIRKASKPAMIVTAILLLIQTGILGLMLLSSLAQGVAQVNIPALIAGLLMFGLPVGLQIVCLYYLNMARRESSDAMTQDWNSPQPWE